MSSQLQFQLGVSAIILYLLKTDFLAVIPCCIARFLLKRYKISIFSLLSFLCWCHIFMEICMYFNTCNRACYQMQSQMFKTGIAAQYVCSFIFVDCDFCFFFLDGSTYVVWTIWRGKVEFSSNHQ